MKFEWVRLFLPGVFSEVVHWRERALLAEKRLGEVVSQMATTLAHEREQFDAERRELTMLLTGRSSQEPPQSAEEEGASPTASSFSIPTHPIQRKRQEFLAQQANSLPDDVVEAAVDEYLKFTAIQ